jgi:TolB-like protein
MVSLLAHRPARPYRCGTPLALPNKPSLAVLPFQNMTGDAEQEYFVDGMVEEITTAIARLPWLFVIARNSVFTYKGKPVDVNQVARELGVRYVLEGSVRKAGNRVRITGQLIDTITGAHIWADRFDGTLDDIFALQDQVASGVAGAIEPKLRQSEIERASRKPTVNLTAYDLFLRALTRSYRFTEEGFAEAVVLARQALAIDPSYVPAAAMVGWCRTYQRVNGWEHYRIKTSAKPADWPDRCSRSSAMTPRRFGRLPGRRFTWPAWCRWRLRLSIAPWRSTRTRLTAGSLELAGISTRCATSPKQRSKPLNGRGV